MKKMHFEEPEMEAVRFDSQDAVIATSNCTGFVPECDIEGEFIPF